MEQMNNSVWLWLSDDECWERFSTDDIAHIEHALDIGNKGVVLERNFTQYFLDLLRLTQTNACTGRRRPIYQVKKGSSWFAQNAETEAWEPFSAAEAAQLEQAFFDGNELFILQRETETLYVDFMKWTVADLSTGSTRHIKVTADEAKEEEEAMPSNPVEASMRSRSRSRSRRTSSSRRRKKEAAKHQLMRQEAKKPQDEMDDDCECTVTTVPDDYDSSVSSNEVPMNHGKPIRRSISRRKRASWRWANDSESWSVFDDEVAAAIERSWEFGAPEMMFERSSTAYFVDLINLTQTNINTGNTRAIQRVEE